MLFDSLAKIDGRRHAWHRQHKRLDPRRCQRQRPVQKKCSLPTILENLPRSDDETPQLCFVHAFFFVASFFFSSFFCSVSSWHPLCHRRLHLRRLHRRRLHRRRLHRRRLHRRRHHRRRHHRRHRPEVPPPPPPPLLARH